MFDHYFPTVIHFDATLAIALATLGFIVFWAVANNALLVSWLTGRLGDEQAQESKIYLQRLVGVCCYGIIPALVFFAGLGYKGSDLGLSWQWTLADLWWTLGLSALAVILSYLGARKPESLAMYPEIRRPVWGQRTLLFSALTWTAYLFAYELTFRGFLLFICERAFGPGPAIAVNTAIYALVHVPKRMTEGVGALILGLVLCLVTLQTGTIWVAFLVHVALSLSNEWFSLRNHPNIHFAS